MTLKSFIEVALPAALLLAGVNAQIQGHCDPAVVKQPNPIGSKSKYRSSTTGTVNGSTIVIPITYTQARSLIPSQYPILTSQYQTWLGSYLASDMYPMIMQLELFHDIYVNGQPLGDSEDYNVAHLSFPFVDRLNNGQSPFAYVRDIIITSNNTRAQNQWEAYGTNVFPGYFASCNAYEYESDSGEGSDLATRAATQPGIDQAGWENNNTNLAEPSMAYRLHGLNGAKSPIPLNFYRNVTSQPIFSSTEYCDNIDRIANTKISTGAFTPVNIVGTADALQPFYGPNHKTQFKQTYALKWAEAYSEKPQVECSSLAGFTVVSPPS